MPHPAQLGEVFLGDAVQFLERQGVPFEPARTVVMTEPPWPTDPDPRAVDAWPRVAPMLPAVADRLIVWYGHRTDPRWITNWVPDSLPFLETKWLECRSPGGQVLTAAELVAIFGRSSWPCGASAISDVINRDSRPGAASCGLGHARRLVHYCVPEGWTVFDPFCGSGTMLVAAAEAGRRFVGIDHDPNRVDLAEARLAELQG